jgi:aryl-alcohol dehydrogenase-like predicted oxidoreductase
MAWNKDGGNARLQPNGEVDNTLRGVRERPGTAASHSKLDAQSFIPRIFRMAKRSTDSSRFVIRSLNRPAARYRRERLPFSPEGRTVHPSQNILQESTRGGNMEHRQLGKNGPQVSALGLGCMGMSFAYGPVDDEESLRVLRRYVELGGNFLDTAEIYGPYKNEELLGRFLREVPRDRVIVATKFGFRIGSGGVRSVDSSPENVRRACDGSLKRLGIETIDLYYQHRVDPKVPIEETVGAMAGLVSAGKVRMIGLSEASPETVRRAAKVHPIAALQSEYSLWSREVEANGVLSTCRELGITFVPYSPLGRGFLTGAIQKLEDLDATDWRRTNPRFGEKALQENLKLAAAVKELAREKGATPAQLALAWVLAQGQDLIPIPGTKRVRYLEDNMGALQVNLTESDRKKIAERVAQFQIVGERYTPDMMALVQRA